MGLVTDLIGTLRTTFKVGKLTHDAGGLTAARTATWPDKAGTVAMTSDAIAPSGGNMTGALNEAKGTNIASAATTDIGAATGNYVVVTGTVTITALGTVQAGTRRVVEFAGALILTYNATSLILPGSVNITTAAGDVAEFISEGAGNWRCVGYTKADGTALVGGAGGGLTIGAALALVNNTPFV